MEWVVVVVQGRYMLFIPAGFHFRFASSVLEWRCLACLPASLYSGPRPPYSSVVFPADPKPGP